jgi:formylglycine-generating enzyme required for sulfatase activity
MPTEFVERTLGMKFRLLPAGTFTMGSPKDEVGESTDGGLASHDPDENQREVTLTRPFYMGIYDVTRSNFAAFVADTNWKTDAEKDNASHAATTWTWNEHDLNQLDDHPVVLVSWNDAMGFCDWLGKKDGKHFRLPLEAEWEYACRAGASIYSPFNTGAHIGLNQANVRVGKSFMIGTTPVGRYPPNAWGLFDIHGNVFQWCYTAEPDKAWGLVWYPDQQPSFNPNLMRVLRGGSCVHTEGAARSASRACNWPGEYQKDVGFRIVMEP